MPGETFKDALAKIDMEFDYSPDRGWTHTILGLKEVEAAHRAEVERAVAEALGAVVPDWLPESTDEAVAAVRECADEIAIRLMRGAAEIRDRGVAKQRTGSEAPSASDEGAKS